MAWTSLLVYQHGVRWQGIVLGLVLGLLAGAIGGATFSDQIRRAVLPAPPTPAIDQHTIDAVNRAATAVEQSLNVGVNLHDFGERVRVLATELALAGDKNSSEQQSEILLAFAEALGAYQDSLQLWNESIRSDEHFLTLRPELISKYGVTDSDSYVRTPYPKGEPYKTYYVDGVNQRIWRHAGRSLDHARALISQASAAP